MILTDSNDGMLLPNLDYKFVGLSRSLFRSLALVGGSYHVVSLRKGQYSKELMATADNQRAPDAMNLEFMSLEAECLQVAP